MKIKNILMILMLTLLSLTSVFAENVTDTNTTITPGSTCPTTETENMNLFLGLAVVVGLVVLALTVSNPIIGIFSGIAMLFYGITIVSCFNVIGGSVIAISIMLMMYFGFKDY